jgi:hypothetical protein
MKILFICKNRKDYSYGSIHDKNGSFGLINSSKFVSEYLNKNKIISDVIMVNDANDIDREVFKRNPDIVVIEALWVTPDKMKEIIKLHHHKNRKWIIRIHSRIPFLATEGVAIEWLYKYIDLNIGIKIAANSEGTAEDLSKILKYDVLKLLNLYPINFDYNQVHKNHDYDIDIGLFGSIRPLKNMFIQAMAAIEFADSLDKKLYLHININTEQNGEPILKNIKNLFNNQSRHRLVCHKWYSHSNFIKLVKKYFDFFIDLCLRNKFITNLISCRA